MCREASGQFAAASFEGDFLADAHQLRIADVDGDGVDDLVAFTLGGVSVRYGSGDGRFVDDFEFPVPLEGAEADVADVNLDGRADALIPVSTGALVLLGQAERVMVPAPFLQAIGDGAPIARLILAIAPAQTGAISTLLLVEEPTTGAPAIELASLSGVGRTQAVLPIPFGASRPSAAIARDADDRLYVAVGFTGGDRLALVRFDVPETCGVSCWPEQTAMSIPLELPASLSDAELATVRSRSEAEDGAWTTEPAVHVVDAADDDALDVIALVRDRSDRLRVIVWPGPDFRDPFVVATESGARLDVRVVADSWPLAFGDVDGDGALDTVETNGVWSSAFGAYIARPQLDLWTEALVADLNRDGYLDVAAASAFIEGVDVFVGSGLPALNRSRIDTSAAVDRLAAGDFNGDFVTDLLFSERTFEDVGDDSSTLFLAPGRLQGAPDSKVTVGKLSYIQEILPLYLPSAEPDLVEDVIIHSSPEPDGRGVALAALLEGSTDGRLVSFLGSGDGSSQALKAGRFSADRREGVDLLLARRLGLEDGALLGSSFVVIGGNGSGVYSESDESDLALDACTRSFDLQTAAIEVAQLEPEDPTESLFIIDKAPCSGETCTATLLISRGDGANNECWWSELVGPQGGVPTDMLVEDVDANGGRELLVAYGFDATPIRGGVFKDVSAAARQTGLAVYWDLDAAAYSDDASGGAVESADAFVGGEVYTPSSALTAEEDVVVAPGADGVGTTGTLQGVRSISTLQADADPDREVVVLSADGVFLAELERPGLRMRSLDIPIDASVALLQVVTGDVDGDGVDDLIISRGERFQVYLGRSVGGPGPEDTP